MDDLAQTYIKRMDRIKCNPEYRIVVNEDTRVVQSVEINASGACEVPLFLSRGGEIDKSTVDSIEQFGNDPKTAWIKLDGTPKSIKFVGDLLWDGDTQSFWSKYRFIILGIIFIIFVLLVVLYLIISKKKYV